MTAAEPRQAMWSLISPDGLLARGGPAGGRYARLLEREAVAPASFEALMALPTWCRCSPQVLAESFPLIGAVLHAPSWLGRMDGAALNAAAGIVGADVLEAALETVAPHPDVADDAEPVTRQGLADAGLAALIAVAPHPIVTRALGACWSPLAPWPAIEGARRAVEVALGVLAVEAKWA